MTMRERFRNARAVQQCASSSAEHSDFCLSTADHQLPTADYCYACVDIIVFTPDVACSTTFEAISTFIDAPCISIWK